MAPLPDPQHHRYRTTGGVEIAVTATALPYGHTCEALTRRLDTRRGVLFSSGMEAPGRYTRWDMGFSDPPLVFTATERRFSIEALNARGAVLVPAVAEALSRHLDITGLESTALAVSGEVVPSPGGFSEEERSRQPSIFSVVRALRELFGSREDDQLGLYGAFAYDLAFQFEPVERRIPRPADARELVLYLPDELLIVDHARRTAERRTYVFAVGGASTEGLPRDNPEAPYVVGAPIAADCDHGPGEYAATVRHAKESFERGDLFEVVPGQVFRASCPDQPSEVFERLTAANPAPYGCLINLGEGEFLVGASPEMYVRVRGSRVETCPISGTIARGRDAFEDADQIRTLLASAKDEAELTMCTDVDRNDKARICEPGSVKVLARRQIETYSRLFHTVDHVEGLLRPEMDALDAFLTHAWAVTVTGAPKSWAMDFIERNERSSRRWYAGAIGRLTFDGNLDTGITIRTARLKDGVAEVRAGATLLHDSDPEAENQECALKASALLASITGRAHARPGHGAIDVRHAGEGRRVLLIDFEDSFVHNLADYLRQTGAQVHTFRHTDAIPALDRMRPDLVVLSPGPGCPADFDISRVVSAVRERNLPIFGVCLGLQGLVEHFGGALDQLAVPVHGKASEITLDPDSRIFGGLPERLLVGRYHSLHARDGTVPKDIRVVARTDDGVVMAIEHESLPIAAVQFHPESILSARGDGGMLLLARVVERLLAGRAPLNRAEEPGGRGSEADPASPARPKAGPVAAA
ncbi:anthranilate synthase component I [Enterovirga rhinocerotis]|uniref:Anthranilate synthase n=1 Tax=Enterovirga rhinocerotis TaxID=1339210 RepID=A0A4R7C673_9HYPH|nr:anthranilate synthase component I [Enterovirga rhinocerotis]TDR93613.1 anthranilate synthase component I [Enterovirga rhinocerotis]